MFEHLRGAGHPLGDEATVRARATAIRRRRHAVASVGAAAVATSLGVLVAISIGATEPGPDTLTPVQTPTAWVEPTAMPSAGSTPAATFTLGPTDTSANGFGWGVPAAPTPTDDRADGVPGWVAPPIGRCQSMTFAARQGGAPSPQLRLQVGAPSWSSVGELGLQVPFSITNSGSTSVTLTFRSRAQVVGPTTAELNATGDTFEFTVAPGETLTRSAQLFTGDCADTSSSNMTPQLPGTYRVGVELVVNGYSPWYATSDPVTVR